MAVPRRPYIEENRSSNDARGDVHFVMHVIVVIGHAKRRGLYGWATTWAIATGGVVWFGIVKF
ncbi:hypothetical protein BLA13014_03393 [Burkholderia aenigmatica]|jgi:hypothetical protein|uniref:Uncharacterized protein n=1 Tax=Burkholderia aenigmatica TaxID=2015348 RepID=A0A6P2M1W9_9BURK|nr:hypothetical protein BLA13014_03393 [Burkholderia aenigmatica]